MRPGWCAAAVSSCWRRAASGREPWRPRSASPRRRARAREGARRRRGPMAAVLGLATAGVEAACDEASGPDGLAVPANLNAPDQTVISGDPVGVSRAGEGCKARGAKRVIALNVSGAFHSPLMAPAVDGLREALAEARVAG